MNTKTKTITELINLVKKDYKKYSETFSINELIKILKKLADEYYNSGNPLVQDDVYDYIRDVLEKKDPTNEFLDEVGAPIRGTKEKVKLPFEMSSLIKFKPDTNAVEKWAIKYTGQYVLSDKLDGASAELYKNYDGKTYLYSRGNRTTGQNISHLLPYFFKNDLLNDIPNGMCIRGELIISKEKFPKISSFMKNARNAVAGLVNSKKVDKRVANITNFIAYSILNPQYIQSKQMELLKDFKMPIVQYKIINKIDDDILKKYLIERKKKSPYEIDGIVCIDDSKIYNNSNAYPEHAFAFKMLLNEQIDITTVIRVIWNPSMDGYLKPTIEIKPIELGGTTITYATAHNAKFIVDNKIGPGAKVKIVRSGDVIPYILEVISPAKSNKPQMPQYSYKWNSSKVDLILKTISGTNKQLVTIKIITHFFKTMGVKYLSEGIITKLVDNDYDSIEKILKADKQKLTEIECIGEKLINKIYNEIDRSFKETNLATFMAASHKFGRGLGEIKINEIVSVYPNILNEKWSKIEMKKKILQVYGFSDISANLFVENFDNFKKFYNTINKIKNLSHYEKSKIVSNINSNKHFKGQIIVFTGFRDADLEKKITENGGKVTGSVSKKTTILVHSDTIDKNSSKFIKASELKIKIMSKSEFLEKFYLIQV